MREAPSSAFAVEGMREIANKGLPNARPVPGLREHYYHEERRRKDAPYIDCNLVMVYHPKPTAWDNKDRNSWILEREWERFGFYCYNDQTDDTIRDAYEGYLERGNCENFYQRLGYFMTILPSEFAAPDYDLRLRFARRKCVCASRNPQKRTTRVGRIRVAAREDVLRRRLAPTPRRPGST